MSYFAGAQMCVNADRHQRAVHECLQCLIRISKEIEYHAAAIDRDLDLTCAQFRALWELGLATDPLALKDLASRMPLDSSTMVGVVDRLVAKGLIQRNPDAMDRRRISLTLTSKGKALLEIARQGLQEPLLGGLSALGEERLLALLEALPILEAHLPHGAAMTGMSRTEVVEEIPSGKVGRHD